MDAPFAPPPSPKVLPPSPGAEEAAQGAVRVPMSEVVAALSTALDLVEGQPPGHAARSCIIGMRLGREIGLSEESLSALYYALLLKDAGCSSNAARMAALFGADDQRVKAGMRTIEWRELPAMARTSWGLVGRTGETAAPLLTRVRLLLGLGRNETLTHELIAARCDRGADIARRLGFPADTVQAIYSLDEHWDGHGYPEGRAGEAIPLFSRILNVAQSVEVFLARDGSGDALDMVRSRRGRWFDPMLVDVVLSWRRDATWWKQVRAAQADEEVAALEPAAFARDVDADGLDQVAQAFADVIDAKSPFTYAHSSNVAAYADAMAARLGFHAGACRLVRRAGLLHDIGKVGVSNRILDKPGTLSAAERTAIQSHPRHTWEILSRVGAFADIAHLAATHHEKLDGSGYPWGLRGDMLTLPARVLVVADILEALTADRPYRSGMPMDKALAILSAERGTKLDRDCVDAVAAVVADRR